MAVDLPANPEVQEVKHLEALNKGLVGVAHPFTKKDLHMHGQLKDTSPLVETSSTIEVGKYVVATIEAKFPKPDGTFNNAIFTPLFHKEKDWKENGAVHIVEAKIDDELPQDSKHEVIKNEANSVSEGLNTQLEEIVKNKFEGKNYRKLTIPNLKEFKIHDVNPGRFVVIEATNQKGEVFPIILNMKDRHTGMEGHIFVAEYPESGDYALLDQPKPVVGQVKLGPPQGFAGPLDADGATYQGLRDEMGIDLLSASIQQLILEEDLRTCLVDDRFFLLHLNLAHQQILDKPDLLQNVGVQLDKLAKKRVSKKQVFDAIINSEINGAHAVAGIALSALNRNALKFGSHIDSQKDGILVKLSQPQFDPTRMRSTLISGHVDAGDALNEVYADPTKFREATPVRKVHKKNLDLADTVFVSYFDLVSELRGGSNVRNSFGVVETAAIFSYMLKSGILVPNF